METSYKEKYEDILARLERAKNDNEVCDERFCCVINEIIPELAESEDDKVRKELLDFCKSKAEKYPNDPKYKNISAWIAWLEKQGQVKESFISQHENKMCKENGNSLTCEDEKVRKEIVGFLDMFLGTHITPTATPKQLKGWIAWLERQVDYANFRDKAQVGDRITKNEDGVLVNLSQLKRVAKPREKQGEQNPIDKVEPKFKVGEKELTNEELCEGLIRGMVNEHNRVTKEVLRTEYEKGRADVLAKIDAIDVDEMVCESCATSRVTQYWYAHGVNDVIKKLKEE